MVPRNRTTIVPSVSTKTNNTSATPRSMADGSALRSAMGGGVTWAISTQRAATGDVSISTQRSRHGVPAGNVLWKYDGDEELAGFLDGPAGSGFAVMLKAPLDPESHPTVDAVMVRPDGKAVTLPVGYGRP